MLDLKAVFGYPDEMPETEATADAPDVTLTEGPDAPGFDFSGWVRGPDARGRMGWESADLPEAVAWWRWVVSGVWVAIVVLGAAIPYIWRRE